MEKYLEILRAFEACGGHGIVYGGCLRDSYHDIGLIKDVDIAVPDTPETLAAISMFTQRHGVRRRDQFIGDYGNYPDVLLSVALQTTLGFDVNFVVLTAEEISTEFVAERCDFGICQIAHDGKALFVTDAFVEDSRNRTFTYLREPFDQQQLDRSLRRWERFKEKFTGWTLKVSGAPHFD